MSSIVHPTAPTPWWPAIALLSAVLLFAATVRLMLPPSVSERYRECSALAVSDPAKAKTLAEGWRGRSGISPIARHCEALALFGLKDYAGSAALLEALAKESAEHQPRLSASLLLQAATARKAAGDALMAVQDIDYALTLDADNAQARELMRELSSRQFL